MRLFNYVIRFDSALLPDYGDISDRELSFCGDVINMIWRNERLTAVLEAFPKDVSDVRFKVASDGTCVMLDHKDQPHTLEDIAPKGAFAWTDDYPELEILTPFRSGKFIMRHMHIPPWMDFYYDTTNIGPAIKRYRLACAEINHKGFI